MKSEEPFNRKFLIENYLGLEDVMKEIIELYLKKGPELLKDVKDSILLGDAKALEISAHSLKGAVSNFYAHKCKMLAWELEKLGGSANLNDTEKLVKQLEVEFQLLHKSLLDFLDQGDFSHE